MSDSRAGFRIPPLVKSVLVNCTPERAFAAFTAEIGTWWPLATHSVGQEKARTCAIEPWQGGRVFETIEGGEEHVWGHIIEWSPPRAFAMTWHPGRQADSAQRVRLVFDAHDEGARITLTHDGWEALGERAQGVRANYDKGWEKVLGEAFKRAAETR
jgi:hypothetical protein